MHHKIHFALILIATLIFFSTSFMGQAILPLSFNGPWNSLNPTEGIIRNNTNTYDGDNYAKLSEDGDWIKINISGIPDKLSFWMKAYNSWGSNDNHIRIYEAANDLGDAESDWGIAIADFDNSFVTSTGVNTGDIHLANTTSWIAIFYTKVAQNVGIDDINISNITGGNSLPMITNIVHTPAINITSSDEVSVSADITDSDGVISTAQLNWGVVLGSFTNTIIMNSSSGDTYTTTSNIPAQIDGITVYYKITAIDNEDGQSASAVQSYVVNDPVTALLLEENFDYPEGSTLNENGWTAHSAEGTNPIEVTNGLYFSGYASSGIGGAAWVDNNGEDVNKTFPEQTDGSVYAAFLVNASATNSEGYFLHLGKTSIGNTFFTRVWINSTGDGIGIGGAAPSEYIPVTPGLTSLVVCKIEIATKVSSLYVFDKFPASEPGSPDQTYHETATITNVGSLGLRQYNSSENVIVDGIRVATSWAEAVSPGEINIPPEITNIDRTPSGDISPGQLVNVSSSVIDPDGNIQEVILNWGTTSGSLDNQINMSLTSDDIYVTETQIPGQAGGTTVFYSVTATDDLEAQTTSPQQNYVVLSLNPQLVLNPTSLSGFHYLLGEGPSQSLTYEVSGFNFVGSGFVTVTAPDDYEISFDNNNYYQSLILNYSGGELLSQPRLINVRMKAGLDVGIYEDTISHFDNNIGEVFLPLIGEVSNFTEVADISGLRSGQANGTIYRLTGEAILSFQVNYRNQKYIQDATDAILIDDLSGNITSTYEIEDGITNLTGTLSNEQNMLVFIPISDPGSASSNNNSLIPIEVTLEELDATYQAKLVKTNLCEFSTTGNFEFAINYPISDPTGSSLFSAQYSSLNYIGGSIPNVPQNITGVILQSLENVYLIARSSSDFEDADFPVISANPLILDGLNYELGNGPSADLSIMVSGINLINDIIIVAPDNYELSLISSEDFDAVELISLTPEDGTVAETNIYVRLKAGLEVGNYIGTIEINSLGAVNTTVTLNGIVSDPNNGGGVETFANLDISGSTYSDGNFTGQDGSTWTFLQARGDFEITGKAITLGKGRLPESNVYSGIISNGVGILNFDYMQAFSTNVDLSILLNNELVATVSSSDEQGIIKNSGDIQVNLSGDITLQFKNEVSTAGQVTIDNVVWTGYSGESEVVSKPFFSPAAGYYLYSVNVSVQSATDGSSIFYSKDSENGPWTAYETSIYLDTNATIWAYATKEGFQDSPVNFATYSIFYTIPSITLTPEDLGNFTYEENSGPSEEKIFEISAENLIDNIFISSTENFEISTGSGENFNATDPIILNQINGIIPSTTIYVRLKAGLMAGNYSDEQISANAAEALEKTVILSGEVTSSGSDTLLFVENFDYPIGTTLTNNGWVAHSGEGVNPPTVTEGLSFEGYMGTKIGGAALLENNGEDIHHSFDEQTSGTVYAAFMINSFENTSAGYFIHFGKNSIGNTYFTRIWINETGNGLGLGQNMPDRFVPIASNQTSLVVMKYDFENLTSSLYVFSNFPFEEPDVADAEFIETSNITNVGSIALRQFNSNENIIIDGINVATTWEEAVAYSGETLSVGSPEFDPPSGNYFYPINVSITTPTSNAILFYSDISKLGPWIQYSGPISLTSDTKLWSYGEKDGYINSPVSGVVYTFTEPITVSDISELRLGDTDGTIYELSGEAIITFITGTNKLFVQDDKAAILIDNTEGVITTTYNLYDGITGLTGKLVFDQNMLEFLPLADPGAVTSNNNKISAADVTLSDLNENYQAQLIKVSLVEFINDGSFEEYTDYSISDESGRGTFRTQYATLDYIGTPIPGNLQDITGVVIQYSTDAQLVARSLDDFSESAISNPLLILNPDALDGFVYNEGEGPSEAQSYELSAQRLEGDDFINIVSSEYFEISEDSINFGDNLKFAFANGEITDQPITVFVRLKSNLTSGIFEGFISHSGGGAYDVNLTLTGEVTNELLPEISFEIVPQYIQGVDGSNTKRVPFAWMATISNLIAGNTYRYINQMVLASDESNASGVGNIIFTNQNGDFYRTTNPSFGTDGAYGTFTTDENGSYSGWFISESTGNVRFTPGNEVFMRIRLNDGNNGTATQTWLTTTNAATVINFGTESEQTQGTAIRAASGDSPQEFVFLYDNLTREGRPLAGTSIETTGIAYAEISQYVAFYRNDVAGIDGSWGTIIPNINENGIQKIEIRKLSDGSVVKSYDSENGIWGNANTINPTGGTSEVLEIDLIQVGIPEANATFKAWTKENQLIVESYTTSHIFIELFNLRGQLILRKELEGQNRYQFTHYLNAGVYVLRISSNQGTFSKKLLIRK